MPPQRPPDSNPTTSSTRPALVDHCRREGAAAPGCAVQPVVRYAPKGRTGVGVVPVAIGCGLCPETALFEMAVTLGRRRGGCVSENLLHGVQEVRPRQRPYHGRGPQLLGRLPVPHRAIASGQLGPSGRPSALFRRNRCHQRVASRANKRCSTSPDGSGPGGSAREHQSDQPLRKPASTVDCSALGRKDRRPDERFGLI